MGPFETLVESQFDQSLVETPWGLAEVRTILWEDTASRPVPTGVMTGTLSHSSSGYALLSVPNDFVKGVFASIRGEDPNMELPISRQFGSGRLNAHISVASGDELSSVEGGAETVRRNSGRKFRYQLGSLKVVTPSSTSEFRRIWYVEVKSPELEEFRKGLGLSARPNQNKFDFHISVGAVFR